MKKRLLFAFVIGLLAVSGFAFVLKPIPPVKPESFEILMRDLDTLRGAKQFIFARCNNWGDTSGEITLYHINNQGNIGFDKKIQNVRFGKKGLQTWGSGWQVNRTKWAHFKEEGDLTSPAGVFPLLRRFAYDTTGLNFVDGLTVLPLRSKVFCVDDPASDYYNQIVASDTIASTHWKSAETMRRRDQQYKYGVEIGHNLNRVSGNGSCIFLHIWADSLAQTAGCTAMAEADMLYLMKWLRRSKNPVLIQMPRKTLERYKSDWSLAPKQP